MKLKLAVLLMIVPSVGLLVASALAQSPLQPPSRDHRDPFNQDFQDQLLSKPATQPIDVPTTGPRDLSAYIPEVHSRRVVARIDLEISNEVDQLVAKLGEARSDTDKDKIKTQLSEVLAKQFDQRQKRHEHEIAELEAKVKKLKDLVARRQDNRRDIITKRVDQILRDSEGLGW
jgi:hypothetical protein